MRLADPLSETDARGREAAARSQHRRAPRRARERSGVRDRSGGGGARCQHRARRRGRSAKRRNMPRRTADGAALRRDRMRGRRRIDRPRCRARIGRAGVRWSRRGRPPGRRACNTRSCRARRQQAVRALHVVLVGDATTRLATNLMQLALLAGTTLEIAALHVKWPSPLYRARAARIANATGATLAFTEAVGGALLNADVVLDDATIVPTPDDRHRALQEALRARWLDLAVPAVARRMLRTVQAAEHHAATCCHNPWPRRGAGHRQAPPRRAPTAATRTAA